MIKALIFDLDGLIMDTESPNYQSWKEIYQSYGFPLQFLTWAQCIGSRHSPFNPYNHLEKLLGKPIDKTNIRAIRRPRFAELMQKQRL